MRRRGFRYVAGSVKPRDKEDVQRQFRPATNDDIETSRREGYGIHAMPDKQAQADPNGDYLKALSADRRKLWLRAHRGTGKTISAAVPSGSGSYGTPSSGCLAQARQALYGNLNSYVTAQAAMKTFNAPVTAATESDPEVVKVMRQWSRCMARRGFQFDEWEEAHKAASELYGEIRRPLPEPVPQEIEIAVADAECSAETGKSAVERTRYSYHQAKLLKEQEAQINAYRKMRERALAKAKDVLGKHAGQKRQPRSRQCADCTKGMRSNSSWRDVRNAR
ncbi:hypothetical protein [Sinosporangium siamense]